MVPLSGNRDFNPHANLKLPASRYMFYIRSMGDLRNKFAKIERDEAHRQFVAKHYPLAPLPKPICCQGCGATYYERDVYAVARDKWSVAEFWCASCLPISMHGTWGRK